VGNLLNSTIIFSGVGYENISKNIYRNSGAGAIILRDCKCSPCCNRRHSPLEFDCCYRDGRSNSAFTIPLNESTSVTWTENGKSTTLATGEGNVATLNHVFQLGSYQVTASIEGAGQIAAWNVEGNPDYLNLEILSPGLNFAAVQGTPELLNVRITNSSGRPVQSSGFKYIIANFSNGDPELQLFDDGTNKDTVAGDGIFSNQWLPVNTSTGKSPTFCILRVSADHERLGFAEQIISGTISRKPTPPDLVMEGISWDPASPYENDSITFRVTFANRGSGASGAFTAKCYINGRELNSYSLQGLEAGSNTSVTFNWVPAASGNLDIKAVVDTENQVSESDEGNNEKTESLSVRVRIFYHFRHFHFRRKRTQIFFRRQWRRSWCFS
jgi:hypothetical protein